MRLLSLKELFSFKREKRRTNVSKLLETGIVGCFSKGKIRKKKKFGLKRLLLNFKTKCMV